MDRRLEPEDKSSAPGYYSGLWRNPDTVGDSVSKSSVDLSKLEQLNSSYSVCPLLVASCSLWAWSNTGHNPSPGVPSLPGCFSPPPPHPPCSVPTPYLPICYIAFPFQSRICISNPYSFTIPHKSVTVYSFSLPLST